MVNVMGGKRGLVYGVGINDAEYVTGPMINRKQIVCPFYQRWASMLERCYSKACHKKHPTYIGCTVCDEWLLFSNFKAWMEQQDWQGKELDKDIIVNGNKIYSPDTCAFVDQRTNAFVIDSISRRGDFMIGVFFNKETKKFRAICSNPFTKKRDFLGEFQQEECAHLAWKKRKHELACRLSHFQDDQRVAAALLSRYL